MHKSDYIKILKFIGKKVQPTCFSMKAVRANRLWGHVQERLQKP
jgi:hypothetical protein